MKHTMIQVSTNSDAHPRAGAAMTNAARLRARLVTDGYAILPAGPYENVEPWTLVQDLIGVWPEMVERQPIRARADGRSFASTNVVTPFHTDSQDYLGAPPALQIMICRRAARDGGATRLLDGARLLARLALEAPALHAQLLEVPRCHRFYFGDVTSATVATKRGHLVWTHSPQPLLPGDAIGETLAVELAKEPVITLPLRDGEILVVDNHRMLHGREAFTDSARAFTRLLTWLPQPIATLDAPIARPRLAIVLELLAGVPPARLAARERISEAVLYAWRSQALAAAASALED